jgi:hypothetical protein
VRSDKQQEEVMATEAKVMATGTKVKWAIEADYLQACNCDYGCPCEFEAPPTNGYCEGVGAWRITKGNYGDVRLDGLGFGFAARWPEAIHKGNGTAALFFDETANPTQREALMQIATGQAGGLPFEIIAATFSKVLEPQYVSFTFDIKGKNSRAKMGNAVTVDFEPVKNPVTGAPEGVRVEHETGFIFKSAEVVSAKTCQASVGELRFSYPNKSGFVAQVKYAN